MFLESILFLQKLKKFQKQCCPILVTQSRVIQVACYSRKLACWFWWLIHEWRVQSRGVHRDFRSSAHDSLASRPSSCENHLENFSQFCLWVFWRLDLATCWQLTLVMKNVCLAKIGSVFKPFQFSLKLFMTIHFLSQLNLTYTLRVTLYKFHCCTCSPPNIQEKRYELLFSHLISLILSFIFVSICVGVLIFFLLLWVCFDVFGIILVWIIKILFLCKLVLVDRFIYFPMLVFLR